MVKGSLPSLRYVLFSQHFLYMRILLSYTYFQSLGIFKIIDYKCCEQKKIKNLIFAMCHLVLFILNLIFMPVNSFKTKHWHKILQHKICFNYSCQMSYILSIIQFYKLLQDNSPVNSFKKRYDTKFCHIKCTLTIQVR